MTTSKLIENNQNIIFNIIIMHNKMHIIQHYAIENTYYTTLYNRKYNIQHYAITKLQIIKLQGSIITLNTINLGRGRYSRLWKEVGFQDWLK